MALTITCLAPSAWAGDADKPAVKNDYFFSDLPPAAPDVPQISLYDVFATGDTSPLGTNVKTVPIDTLFDEGAAFMKGSDGHARDPREGLFWLRRAIVTSPDPTGRRRAWALMTLGLAYAQGDADTKTSLVVARHLWEMAGALGDPSALCNMGRLVEDGGDGVKADKAQARVWYERAKVAGCPAAASALARLKP